MPRVYTSRMPQSTPRRTYATPDTRHIATRTDRVYVRLTPAERLALDRQASRRGMTPSDVVREAISVQRDPTKPPSRTALARATAGKVRA